MRQNFVINKDEEKGKHTAIKVLGIIGDIQFILGLVGCCVTEMEASFFYGLISMGIFYIISFFIWLSIEYKYHGCFSMEGLTIDVKIVDRSLWNGLKWEARVNNVLLPKVSGKNDLIDKFECKINNIHDFEVYCKDSPVIKIDGLIVVEEDVVYVDKIKQALNMY